MLGATEFPQFPMTVRMGEGEGEGESDICFAYLAAFLRLLWGNCSAHDVPHVNRMCYFLLQDIV